MKEKIQIIGQNKSTLLEKFGGDVKISTFGRSGSIVLDSYDINIIYLTSMHFSSYKNYLVLLGNIIERSKNNKKIILIYPQNGKYWDFLRNSYYLKNNTKTYESCLEILNVPYVSLHYEYTETKIRNNIISSDYCFDSLVNGLEMPIKTISFNNSKITTTETEKFIHTTLNISSFDELLDFLNEIGYLDFKNFHMVKLKEKRKEFLKYINSKLDYINYKKILRDNFTYILAVIIIIVIWIPFIELYYFSHPWQQMANYLNIMIALFAFTGTIISIIASSIRFEKNLINSNKQLTEQLTRQNKEKALFDFLKESMIILNEEFDDFKKGWVTDIHCFVDGVEGSRDKGEHCYFSINMFMQNDIYYYFKNLINDPYNFFYLPHEIQKRIIKFNEIYYDIYTSFMLFLGLRFEGSLKLIDKLNTEEYEFSVVDKNSKLLVYSDIGNYITKDYIDKNLLKPTDYKMGSVEYGKESFVLKIGDNKFKALEKEINCIYYLAYKESLKYGYSEIKNE